MLFENIWQIFCSSNWEKSRLKLNFQLPQYKRGINVVDTDVAHNPAGFLSAGQLPVSRSCHGDIKVWLVQSQNPDSRFISQIDIVMCIISCFIRHFYNITMSSEKYCLYNSECYKNCVKSFFCEYCAKTYSEPCQTFKMKLLV